MNKSLTLLFNIFRANISDIDDHTCPMHPTCSKYCLISVRKYGFIVGSLKTLDRLHRCNHDLKYYKISKTGKRLSYNDVP